MSSRKLHLQGIADTESLAREVAERVRRQSPPRFLLLLDGPMGAGKTRFTRALIEALGGDETASPSFAIHHSYRTALADVEHFDLFRLEGEDDLESTGFWDFFRSPSGVIVIEWADRLREMGLADQLPRQWPSMKLRFEVIDHSTGLRQITIE